MMDCKKRVFLLSATRQGLSHPAEQFMHNCIYRVETFAIFKHYPWLLDVRSGNDFLGAVGYQLLCTCKGCFEVKLQADNSFIIIKRLVFTSGAVGYVLGSFRNIEGIAVPVKCFETIWKCPEECAGACDFRGFNRKPANFFMLARIYSRAKDTGKELSTKANAQDRSPLADGFIKEPLFFHQPRIRAFFIDVHWTTHYYQQINTVDGWQLLLEILPSSGQTMGVLSHPRFDTA